jgi:hypothetical protein
MMASLKEVTKGRNLLIIMCQLLGLLSCPDIIYIFTIDNINNNWQENKKKIPLAVNFLKASAFHG